MMSPSDFDEKQIVFLRAKADVGEVLKFKNDNIYIQRGPGRNNQISCFKVFALIIIGECTLTTRILQKCKEFGIAVVFLSHRLKPVISITGGAEGNYLLRQKQYLAMHELQSAQRVVLDKVRNQMMLLDEIKKIPNDRWFLEEIKARISKAINIDELRGIEGAYAKEFFSQYYSEFGWRRRAPRSHEDEINLILDIGYTMLFHFIEAMISLYGFDAYKGFYHQLFFQRKSLVCDLVEPFRCLIDRQVRKSLRLKQFRNEDFVYEKGEYRLPWDKSDKYVQVLTSAILERKEDIFRYIRKYYYFKMNNSGVHPSFTVNV